MIVALPVTVLVLSALFGGVMAYRRNMRAFWIAVAALILLLAAMFLIPKTGQGFEDIGYAIVAYLFALPGTVGLLGGGLLGWLFHRHRKAT